MSTGNGGGSSISNSYGSGYSTSNPVLYNWKDILPPWVSQGQQQLLPYLEARAATGLLPQEERGLWGQARNNINVSSEAAGKNLQRQLAGSGMTPNSPMVAGTLADLASDRISTTSKAALDFAKMKMGAKDTAIGQLLTSLYTPSPVAVGSSSYSTYSNTGSSSGPAQQGGK